MKIFSAQLKGTTTVAEGATASLTGSFTGSIAGIDINSTNTFTSSTSARLNSIETISASNIARISSLETTSASVNTLNTTQNSRLTNLESITGSLATTGSNTFIGTQTITGSLFISSNLIVQGTSSLQNITASAVSIGTNIVNLNTANPAIRYAGLVIGDSGSIGSSGSFFYDSVQDEMIFIHRGTNTTVTSSVTLMGPQTYDNIGNETYPTLNIVQKGTGNEHLVDSCIFDNGTTICVNATLKASGQVCGVMANFNCIGVGINTPSSGRLEIQETTCKPGLWVQTGGTTTSYCVASFRTGTNLAALEIYGNGTSVFGNNICVNANSNTFGTTAASGRAIVVQAGSTNQAIQFKNCWGGDGTLYACGNATAFHYGFNTYSCSDVVFIANGGNVGFSCNNPGYTIDVNGTGHFSSAGGTMLIESTQPTNQSTLKIIQCSTGGNGNTDQGLVVQTNAGDGTSNIAHFYDYNNGSPCSRLVIKRNGNIGLGILVPNSQLQMKGNITFSENGYDDVRLHTISHSHSNGSSANNVIAFNVSDGAGVGTTAERMRIDGAGALVVTGMVCSGGRFISNVGATTSTYGFTHCGASRWGRFGMPNSSYMYLETNADSGFYIDGQTRVGGYFCASGNIQGGHIKAYSSICANGVRLGQGSFNTGYTSDGIYGATATPSYIVGSGYNSGFYLGYVDNGSGLYGAAYAFNVKCTHGGGGSGTAEYDAIRMRNDESGVVPFRLTNWGNLYATSKNFRINHPLPSMSNTHHLIHTAIEGPQADLIYRGKVELVNGKAEVNIDESSRMTIGTFELLCQNVQSYTTNESGWALIKSYVVGNILHIEAQDETISDTISWLVIGERKDDGMKNSNITDNDCHLVVETLIPELELEL